MSGTIYIQTLIDWIQTLANEAYLRNHRSEAINLIEEMCDLCEIRDRNENGERPKREKGTLPKGLKKLPGEKHGPIGLLTFSVFENRNDLKVVCLFCTNPQLPCELFTKFEAADGQVVATGLHRKCAERYFTEVKIPEKKHSKSCFKMTGIGPYPCSCGLEPRHKRKSDREQDA